jgi:tetratricopeptide (TPR) repeat protein
LAGDSDAIVAKAMRKEPGLRYASVGHLAVDLERYLEGWPVQARHGDVSYRARKFLRRNRVAILVGALLAATLVAGATTATLQARRADRERLRALANQSLAEASQREARRQASEAERQRGLADGQRRQAEMEKASAEAQRRLAERRFEQVHQLAGKFRLDFNDSIAKLPGSTTARKMVVETGLKYFDALVRDARGNRALLEEIARGYDRLGDVQGNPYEANLGDIPGALQTYRKAQAIRQTISGGSLAFLRARIDGNLKIAELLLALNDTAGAEPVLQAALTLARSSAAAGYDMRAKLADTYIHFGDLKARIGLYTEAIEPYSQALDLSQALAQEGGNPGQVDYKASVAHSKLADAYARTERAPEALAQIRAALDIDLPRSQADPDNLTAMRKVFLDYVVLSYIYLSDSGKPLDPERQASAFENAAALADKMAAADPKDFRPLTDVRTAQLAWGDYLREHNDPEGALVHYRRSLELAEKQNAVSPRSAELALLMTHHRLARGLIVAGRSAEALDHVRQAESYLSGAMKQSPGLTAWIQWGANLYRVRGLAYSQLMNWPEAIAAYKADIAALNEVKRRDPNDGGNWYELRIGYAELADCYAGAERWKEAAEAMQSALDVFQEISARRPLRADEEQAKSAGFAKMRTWKAR